MSRKSENRAKNARLRAVCAIILALVLLASTGFAVVDMLRGAEFVSDATQLGVGDYVTTNIDMILGYYAEEYNKNDKVTALYAVVPYDGRFAAVILPQRYFESADVIFDSTYAFINGESGSVNEYILVTGTAEELTGETSGMLYEWFGLNKDWMTEAGLISGEVTDYAEHLSDVALRVDRTGALPTAWAVALTGLAWALLMYAVVVFLHLTLGRYDPKPETPPEEAAAADDASDGEVIFAEVGGETAGEANEDHGETEECDSEA